MASRTFHQLRRTFNSAIVRMGAKAKYVDHSDMQPDPNIPPLDNDASLAGSAPPLLPSQPNGQPPSHRAILIVLSICLGVFLADAVVSFVDDSLILLFDLHAFAAIRGILFFFALLITMVVYVMMAFTPIIPKRLFLPVTLFNLVASLVVLLFSIYFFDRLKQISWSISLCQVIVGLIILYWAQGGLKFRWPLVAKHRLGTSGFSWKNFSVFAVVNILVLLPAVVLYLGICSALAVDHFSDGFLSLRPSGLTVKVRKYVRADDKTILLVPMSHVGDSGFYQKLSQSFPKNAIILMEGVSDNQNLLTNKITYKRMANSMGLTEQVEEFRPQGQMVPADLDVDQFTTNTINLLNLIMLVHAKGLNDKTLLALTEYVPPPHFEKQLFDDLLRKRNAHLLKEISSRLLQTENIIVPWGAAHIPEIAKEIQKESFRLQETQEFVAIRFGSTRNKFQGSEKQLAPGKPD